MSFLNIHNETNATQKSSPACFSKYLECKLRKNNELSFLPAESYCNSCQVHVKINVLRKRKQSWKWHYTVYINVILRNVSHIACKSKLPNIDTFTVFIYLIHSIFMYNITNILAKQSFFIIPVFILNSTSWHSSLAKKRVMEPPSEQKLLQLEKQLQTFTTSIKLNKEQAETWDFGIKWIMDWSQSIQLRDQADSCDILDHQVGLHWCKFYSLWIESSNSSETWDSKQINISWYDKYHNIRYTV